MVIALINDSQRPTDKTKNCTERCSFWFYYGCLTDIKNILHYLCNMRITTIITILLLGIQHGFAQNYAELCEAGRNYLNKKEYKKAAEAFSRANSAASNNSEKLYTLANLGQAQSMMNKHEQAAENFGKALVIEPSSPTLLLQRGNSLLQIDSAQTAIECYNKILQTYPANREARFFRAYAYSILKQYKESKLDYIKLISANPDDKEARLGLAVLYQREGSVNESLMMLEALIEDYPEDAELYQARCNLEREQGQAELALQDIEKAIELSPDNAEFRIIEAELLQQLGRKEAARKSRNAATKISSTPR